MAEASQPTASASLCAICQSQFVADESLVSCPDCHAVYHSDCWQENGGCAVYGCSQVPPTEHRENIEIPVSYWGQENKPCPVCGVEILAAALRCRNCGTVFPSARPEDTAEFRQRALQELRLPSLRKKIVWLFITCVLPLCAPVAALIWIFWYKKNKNDIKALPSLHQGLCKIGLIVGLGQAALIVVLGGLYAVFRSS